MATLGHTRHGHVRFPNTATPSTRVNPPTSGGTAMPDERVVTFLNYVEDAKVTTQVAALSAWDSADARAIALGRYHAILEVRARFLELFRTAIRLPEPEGEAQ